MRVRGSCKWNSLFHRQFNDPVTGVKFVYRLAPSCGGELDRKIARTNKVQRFVREHINLCLWSMTMDLDEIDMRNAVNQTSRRYLPDTAKVIDVNLINVGALELPGAFGNAVE